MSTKTRVALNKESLSEWNWDLGRDANVKSFAKEISKLYADLMYKALTEENRPLINDHTLLGIIEKASNVVAVSAAGVVFDQIKNDASTPILHLHGTTDAHINVLDDGELVITFDFDEMVLDSAEDAVANTCDEWDGIGDVKRFATHMRMLADKLDGIASVQQPHDDKRP